MTDEGAKRLTKVMAWLLLALIIVALVSGWGITRTEIIYRASLGLIDRGTANAIHRDIQIPIAAVLLTHILINVKFNLLPERWRKRRAVTPILITAGIGLLALAIYMQQYP
jgi:hypothetical protein